ncbi:unnamed protein product [Ectocarpus sp. CCAP 1310/34]|nr:unnamed protein product [Ectocarpus sp. CCAP 1310/34]
MDLAAALEIGSTSPIFSRPWDTFGRPQQGAAKRYRGELPKAYFMEDIPGNIAAGNRIWTGWWGEDTLPGADGTGSALNTFCMCNIEICLDR